MLTHRGDRLLFGLMVAVATLNMAVSAEAQEKKIKIGVIYDLTGPLAGGGSELQYIGAKIISTGTARQGSKVTRLRRSMQTPRASPTSPSMNRCA
jgi:branched-chain amino acid transport system substrate-binding protein